MDEKRIHELEAGMRLIANYAQRVARERSTDGVEAKWSYRGALRDGPSQFVLTLKCDGRAQEASLPREAIEDYPGAVGVARTQAIIDGALRRLYGPRESRK